MRDLKAQLETCLRGRACLMGLGNVDCGDDAFGVRLAEAVAALQGNGGGETRTAAPSPEAGRWFTGGSADPAAGGSGVAVVLAGTEPERFMGRLCELRCDHLIFLDAAQFGGSPGSVAFLSSNEMATRFPQVSTHKLSLGLLAKLVEAGGSTRVWLLAAQPASLQPGAALSPAVAKTVQALTLLFSELLEGLSVQLAIP